MNDSNDYFVIPHRPLADFGRTVLEAVKVPPAAATLVADSLVSANLRGVDSHGVQLLIWYTQQIQDGNIDIATSGQIASENGSCMVYDGLNGLGQVVSDACCDHAIRLARANGLGMVTARNSSHFGASAWWAQKIAAAGLIALERSFSIISRGSRWRRFEVA